MFPTVLANMKGIDISVISVISSYSSTIIDVISNFSNITPRRMSYAVAMKRQNMLTYSRAFIPLLDWVSCLYLFK